MSLKIILGAGVATLALAASPAAARTQIREVGSTTVFPFAKAVSEQFVRANPKFQPPVIEGTGTGAGAKLFCAGVGAQFPDIENASRRIKVRRAQGLRLARRDRRSPRSRSGSTASRSPPRSRARISR